MRERGEGEFFIMALRGVAKATTRRCVEREMDRNENIRSGINLHCQTRP